MQNIFNKALGYEHFFIEQKPKDISHFVSDIPSDILIGYLAMINALIYTRQATHVIINTIIPTVEPHERASILYRIYHLMKVDPKNEPLQLLFRPEIILRFMIYELTHFRKLDKKRLLPGDDMNIFKAYIWLTDEFADEMKKFLPTVSSSEFEFQETMWPILVKQYQFSVKINEFYKDFKVQLFFDLLNKSLKEYSDNYLAEKGYSNIEKLLSDYLNLTQMTINEQKKQLDPTYEIRLLKPNSLFDSLTIDISNISSNVDQLKDFVPIKEKPLYLNENSTYNVLSWEFLNNIYDITFLFDFYKYSGIKKIFPTFLHFKNYYGKEFMEKIYFRKIIEIIFHKKHNIVRFDNESESMGLPDCYIRDGNYIYLFECKDTLMPSNIVSANKYEDILNDISTKFIKNSNGRKKGLIQLADTILKISTGEMLLEDPQRLELKKTK